MTVTTLFDELPELAEVVRNGKHRPYPHYSRSESNWLGALPSHWKTRRLKFIARSQPSNVDKKSVEGEMPVRLCNYVDVYKNDYITADLDFMQATCDPAELAKFRLREGDVLITKDSEEWNDIAVPAFVTRDFDDVACGYHLSQVRPRRDVMDGEYLFRAFRAGGVSEQFQVSANGVTRFGIPAGAIGDVMFPIPPLEEQRAIARFLREETARIDRLILEKTRLLELLGEKRFAAITHAVHHAEKYKPIRLRFCAELLPGFAFKSEGFTTDGDDVPLLRGINVCPGRLDWTETVRWSKAEVKNFRRYELRNGDIVMGMDRPWISEGMRVARVRESDLPCLLLQRVARIRATSRLHQDYLELLVSSRLFTSYFEPILTGVSVPHISPDQILDCSFRLPPLDVQAATCEQLRSEFRVLSATSQKTQDAIDRLREYRSALITAAVTGAIDVRKCRGGN